MEAWKEQMGGAGHLKMVEGGRAAPAAETEEKEPFFLGGERSREKFCL